MGCDGLQDSIISTTELVVQRWLRQLFHKKKCGSDKLRRWCREKDQMTKLGRKGKTGYGSVLEGRSIVENFISDPISVWPPN